MISANRLGGSVRLDMVKRMGTAPGTVSSVEDLIEHPAGIISCIGSVAVMPSGAKCVTRCCGRERAAA